MGYSRSATCWPESTGQAVLMICIYTVLVMMVTLSVPLFAGTTAGRAMKVASRVLHVFISGSLIVSLCLQSAAHGGSGMPSARVLLLVGAVLFALTTLILSFLNRRLGCRGRGSDSPKKSE